MRLTDLVAAKVHSSGPTNGTPQLAYAQAGIIGLIKN